MMVEAKSTAAIHHRKCGMARRTAVELPWTSRVSFIVVDPKISTTGKNLWHWAAETFWKGYITRAQFGWYISRPDEKIPRVLLGHGAALRFRRACECASASVARNALAAHLRRRSARSEPAV